MVNVCAKPGCVDSVHLWLDFAPSEQRVVERTTRSDSTVGLCVSHEDRFSVPAGWVFERLPSAEPVATSQATPDLVPSATQREATRGQPWFLALTDREPLTHKDIGHEEQNAEMTEVTAPEVVPTAGSLLHRAFHGPDPDADAHRAALDELESRREARAHDDDGTIELPFPPYGPEQHVAVS